MMLLFSEDDVPPPLPLQLCQHMQPASVCPKVRGPLPRPWRRGKAVVLAGGGRWVPRGGGAQVQAGAALLGRPLPRHQGGPRRPHHRHRRPPLRHLHPTRRQGQGPLPLPDSLWSICQRSGLQDGLSLHIPHVTLRQFLDPRLSTGLPAPTGPFASIEIILAESRLTSEDCRGDGGGPPGAGGDPAGPGPALRPAPVQGCPGVPPPPRRPHPPAPLPLEHPVLDSGSLTGVSRWTRRNVPGMPVAAWATASSTGPTSWVKRSFRLIDPSSSDCLALDLVDLRNPSPWGWRVRAAARTA